VGGSAVVWWHEDVGRRQRLLDIQAAAKDYLLNRSMRERSEHFEGTLKKEMMAELELRGEPGENKRTLRLDEPLSFTTYKDGKPREKRVVGVERRERTSTILNTEKAMALIEKKQLVEECTEVVTVVSEDAILAANYQGKITDKELAGLYEENTTYAFWLTEE
jgi:hypothetical protein